MAHLPIIGISMGDPLGVGPEIIAKALSGPELFKICRPLVLGDRRVLEKAARIVDSPLSFRIVDGPGRLPEPGMADLMEISQLRTELITPGQPTRETGRAMVEYVFSAIDMALAKKIHGIATGPIHKAAINAAGFHYNGHTEILAKRTHTKDYVMMMAGDRLRVTLVTIHQSLKSVPQALSISKILTTIKITHKALTDRFGIPEPRLCVAALNPHAGEDGLFGDEETRLILPAINKAREQGMDITGPLPPDTLFVKAVNGPWDAVICMYHDQGLIPFKMIHFENGVNTTLGLPIIRTSVDHGTAYDISGTGRADSQSLVAAIKMAAKQANNLFGPFSR